MRLGPSREGPSHCCGLPRISTARGGLACAIAPRARSSVAERSAHIGEVGGSSPPAPTTIIAGRVSAPSPTDGTCVQLGSD
jgi:hypothetical protein